LARRLADDWTREAAVEEVVASADAMIPLLLSWTAKPPDGIMARFLDVGLADAFGRMKTEAAIPFLVREIDLDRSIASFAPWIKPAENIEAAYPAAAALIRIGPAGARAVIKAADGPMTREQRRLAIFVVGRTKGAPEAREFLTTALAWANSEREWAERGLKALEP
jgi:HEAT repeat protein